MVLLCYLLILLLCRTSLSRRAKRVLNAEVIDGRTTGYTAVNYLAAIGTLHSVSWYSVWEFLKVGKLFCGGALITRDIVQTACHCLVHSNSQASRDVKYPQVKHGWEDEVVVYVGVNRQYGETENILSMSYVTPFKSRRFLVHQKCVKLPKGMTFTTPYDFGWVIIDSEGDWTHRRFNWVTFAPQYTDTEIDNIWKDLMSRLPVCLHLGFGRPDRHSTFSSDHLRYGWANLISQTKCVPRSAIGMSRQNVTDWFSWVCTAVMPRHYQPPTPGDSGGPFTCNNYYFGVVSGGEDFYKDEEERQELLSFHDPIKLVKRENAINYRTSFVLKMLDYAATTPPPPPFWSLRKAGSRLYPAKTETYPGKRKLGIGPS